MDGRLAIQLEKKINLHLEVSKTNFLIHYYYYSRTWKTLEEIGSTFRMGDAQAAVIIVQLKKSIKC